MKEYIILYLPFLMSILTLYQTFLMGKKDQFGWLVGLFNSACWTTWILVSENYGLLPMNIGLWILYIKGYINWNKYTPSNICKK